MCRVPQEKMRQEEERKLARVALRAEKAEKAAAAAERRPTLQVATGVKKHKRGPSTAGTPLVQIAWEVPAAWPSPLPAVVAQALPVDAVRVSGPFDPSHLAIDLS